MSNIKISVCIPVYESEGTLYNCLVSIAEQSFTNYEILVVDDCSPIVNNLTTKSIIDQFKLAYPLIKIVLLEHEYNKGCLEARRTAFYASKGEFITFIDSDDKLLKNALSDFYSIAEQGNYDIIQGLADVKLLGFQNDEIEKKINKITSKLYKGSLTENILESFLLKSDFNGFYWGKLYKRSVLQKVFDVIPEMYCILAEDFCLSFFTTYFAHSYFGFDKKVYVYQVGLGITSTKSFSDIKKFEKICSASSVFTILFSFIQENNLSIQIKQQIQKKCIFYVKNNLNSLLRVIPELKQDAINILYDYWGESLVKKVQSVQEEDKTL